MPSKFVEIVPLSHRQGNCIPFAAIRWHDLCGICKRLRKRARELNLADAEVARRAGLEVRRYGHYVTGAREPGLETLVRICTVLETTPNALLGFDDTDSLQGDETRDKRERATIRASLIAASNVLETKNLRLAVKQVEVLVRHQREQKRRA